MDSYSTGPAPAPAVSGQEGNTPTSRISSWRLKLPQFMAASQERSQAENAGMSALARFTNGFGSRMPSAASLSDEGVKDIVSDPESGVLGSFRKGLVDSSRSVVNAMQVKARHMVSQNKRRYMEGGFDLDMTYITENIIAMGFPAGSMTSGIFGYIEGFYRNHMEEVIKFFETHHQGKYKVYNLCSERLYDASLFGGKVATFPFDDHNCPPVELIMSFCQSAYSWLKEDIQNVVAIHCKAGMARTGLMICSLLLFLKFFPTAEDAMDYYNRKRCLDAKALVLPSQIRYVKYFECILKKFNEENQHGRRCMLRGFRLHKCPYWIRPSITISSHKGMLFSTKKHPKTKDLMPEDFWIKSSKKGILVFALPGEPGLTELSGDFKIHFHDRQGDFCCWLNTTMTENRTILDASDLDGFDKRKLPSPGFQVEIVMIDYDGTMPTKSRADSSRKISDGSSSYGHGSSDQAEATSNENKVSKSEDNDNVFSDSDEDETERTKSRPVETVPGDEPARSDPSSTTKQEIGTLAHETDHLSLGSEKQPRISTSYKTSTDADGAGKPASRNKASALESAGTNDIKAIAADASVFTFGDDEDFESD